MTALAPAGPRPPRQRKLSATRRNEAAALVLPSLIPVVALSVLPILIGLGYAFTDSQLASTETPQFVGLDNFGKVFRDEAFWNSFGIGAIWTISVTVLQVVLGLCLALLLNTDMRFGGFARVLAIIPWAMPPVVVAIMWKMIYSPTNGPLNWLIAALGGPDSINWLGDFTLALPAVILVGVWTGIPQNTITMLAGLEQIPSELMEAATVDGAGAWARFVHVTLPGLRPVIVSIATLSAIWNFNSFGIVYVLTGGGPGGRTLLPMLFVYDEAFHNGNTGVAAAMTFVILLVLVVILLLSQLTRLRRLGVSR
ncbi:carbohydrate ABC transporter permease [Microbacterium elymi]|uniref:Sugar ABC transporter permease n=1 Tax=Microbacterium elymi TaxID=2909587 RepID=A0ABY5NHF4_9MICO|nr:sugar ABC transporter permease [Microbacterium elymi]UUT34624.1 sugar ABC transporter permease [Microbacterium elymi]